ncbi:uncharacterized protein K460DRAFT_350372 [Cucurbitaria berberidis CBS 394.84]|uniref:Uncharacterized protein n=1 Tax=Cucurbitaria berberidis CBS 394.84 TaxID=1168544 RepID=A0A9P4GS52_9PLEO|nr:uncharacterized protein K460DRAFT_350372 [Cucurbitaria berberidis CBS 394.84]KAF1850299.1 hypothetical protein K460DRAFT_350372 [Cucurbitaria berberidis CBS 394.84]
MYTSRVYSSSPDKNGSGNYYNTGGYSSSGYPSNNYATSAHSPSHPSAYTNSNAHKARDISPPRSPAEQPQYNVRGIYTEHRSVSPLGSSQFERSSESKSKTPSKDDRSRRTATASDARGVLSHERYNAQPSATQSSGGNASLSRCNAVRGRTPSRANTTISVTGEYGTSEARAGLARLPRTEANFRGGGFSSWETY